MNDTIENVNPAPCANCGCAKLGTLLEEIVGLIVGGALWCIYFLIMAKAAVGAFFVGGYLGNLLFGFRQDDLMAFAIFFDGLVLIGITWVAWRLWKRWTRPANPSGQASTASAAGASTPSMAAGPRRRFAP